MIAVAEEAFSGVGRTCQAADRSLTFPPADEEV